jgi:hypothetical protein
VGFRDVMELLTGEIRLVERDHAGRKFNDVQSSTQ